MVHPHHKPSNQDINHLVRQTAIHLHRTQSLNSKFMKVVEEGKRLQLYHIVTTK
jgi:hypothetical protein